MMHPVTLVLLGAGAQAAAQLIAVLGRWLTLRARADLARAAATLPTGVEALPQWSSVENPAGWLYTVARHNTVKAANKAARRGELIDLDRRSRTTDRSVSVRTTSGGLPGLGKRDH